MKKLLPIILLILGVGVLIGAIFFVKGRNKSSKEVATQEETVPEVPLEKKPIVSLTPSSDGHWLTLNVEKIQINAATLEYELLYNLPDGRTQGVPGTVKLTGEDKIERKLLLGSESSGKFRYDEGVEKGTLTLKFRDNNGKLVAKFSTDFVLKSNDISDEITSTDGKISFGIRARGWTTKNAQKNKEFFVLISTFGVPENPPGEIIAGPYGIFSHLKEEQIPVFGTSFGDYGQDKGIKYYNWSESAKKWVEPEYLLDATALGIYIGLSLN